MIPLILHIGSHKTGSTYLQNWLVQNHGQLKKLGIFTADSLQLNHRIAAEVAKQYPEYETQYTKSARTIPLEEAMMPLVAKLPGNYRHSVVSSEFLFDMDPGHIRKVLDKLGFDVVKVVCFLRRQDRLLASSYAQEIKMGEVKSDVVLPKKNGRYEWFKKFDAWKNACLDTVLEFYDYEYEKSRSALLSRFKEAIECPAVIDNEILPDNSRANLSYDAEILEILRQGNELGFSAFGRWLKRSAAHFIEGPTFGLGSKETAELETMFRQKNERFQEAYGSDRFPFLCEKNWKSEGLNMFGELPEARLLAILEYLQRLLILSGKLPLGSNGSSFQNENFEQLNQVASVKYSRDILRLVENAASELIGKKVKLTSKNSEEFPVVAALSVLDYACKQLIGDHQMKNVTGKGPRMSKRDFQEGRLPHNITRPSLSDFSLSERAKFGAQLLWDTVGFDAEYYAAANPDVLVQKVDPYEHFYRYGRLTKKICRPPFRALQNTSWKWKPGDTRTLGNYSEFDDSKETVLIVLHEGSRTGAPIIGYNLLLHFVKQYNVVCLILAPGPIARACRDAGAVVVQAKERANSWAAGAYLINKICEKVKIRFAIVNSALSRFVLGGLVMNDIPRVSLIHEAANTYLATHELPYLLTLSDEVVVPSDYVLNSIRDACPQFARDHFPVIPQGICTLPSDIHEAKMESSGEVDSRLGLSGKSGDTILIAGIGTVDYRKGVDLFLQTASRLLHALPGKNIRFSWVGTGYEPETRGDFPSFIADQLEKSELSGKLTFAGGINNMDAVYKKVDLLLLTSRMDPMPNVAIEAMAHEIPLVCFEKCTGTATYLSRLGLGKHCVAKYLDCSDMANKTVTLLTEDSIREKVSACAKEAVEKELEMGKYCKRIEEIANHICGHR